MMNRDGKFESVAISLSGAAQSSDLFSGDDFDSFTLFRGSRSTIS
jgi:hypothetical protein